jgi:hypothetical protein
MKSTKKKKKKQKANMADTVDYGSLHHPCYHPSDRLSGVGAEGAFRQVVAYQQEIILFVKHHT